jgi:hypothetical protein
VEHSPFERDAGLGSRRASSARHSCVGGRHQDHVPAHPLGILDQLSLGGSDGAVRSLPRHWSLAQELGLEVLHGDPVEGPNDLANPLPCGVLALSSDLAVLFGRVPLRLPVPLRGRLAGFGFPPGHPPLVPSEPRCGSLAMLGMDEVVAFFAGGGNALHAPVNSNSSVGRFQRLLLAPDHETRVPMTQRVPVDPDAARFAWQRPRPHHWNNRLTRQAESTILDGEPAFSVVQTGKVTLGALETPGLTRAEAAQRLLLSNNRAGPQPVMLGPQPGQVGVLQPRLPVARGRHRLVPQPAATVPLELQFTRRSPPRPKAKPVPKHNLHTLNNTIVNLDLAAQHGKSGGTILPGLKYKASRPPAPKIPRVGRSSLAVPTMWYYHSV